MKKALIFCLFAAAIVSAQPKQRIAVLPTVGGAMEPEEQNLLTDKVRELAAKNLPIENFIILKQDQIIKRIGGEEELYRSCKEGVCIGDLAKRIDVDYGSRCEVVKVKNRLVLKFELYSVSEDAIFETFIDHGAKDIFGMLTVLEKRLPEAFRKMVSAYKAESTKPVPPPEPPQVQLPPEPPKQTSVASASAPPATTLVDRRDGKRYKIVKIGNQTWMAENLNYAAAGSKCYGNSNANCEKYGRLYNWATARQACPAGWHLPSDAEWEALKNAVGGAGGKLKSTRGWNNNGNGTNDYGFSALPGGYGFNGGDFGSADNDGYWWSASEYDAYYAWSRGMNYVGVGVYKDYNDKWKLYSVRCVQD